MEKQSDYYWARVAKKSATKSLEFTCHSPKRIAIEIVSVMAAWAVLKWFGLFELAHEHILWEIARFAILLGAIYPLAFVVYLFVVPAEIDATRVSNASTREAEWLKREADLIAELETFRSKKPPCAPALSAFIKNKIDPLDKKSKEVLHHLATSEDADVDDNDLSSLFGADQWFMANLRKTALIDKHIGLHFMLQKYRVAVKWYFDLCPIPPEK